MKSKLLTAITLVLMAIFSILVRVFAVVKHGPFIQEFDPQFNFYVANYIEKHNITSYFLWFDNTTWFPTGRVIPKTAYPGLMFVVNFIHDFLAKLHIFIDLKTICIYSGPLFSVINLFYTFFFGRLLKDSNFGLLCAFISILSPGQIQASTAGEFEYESLGITLIIASSFHFLKGIKTDSVPHLILSSLYFGCLCWTWGGYVYLTNCLALFLAALFVFKKLTLKLSMQYAVWFVLSFAIASKMPNIEEKILTRAENIAWLAAFFFCLFWHNKHTRILLVLLGISLFFMPSLGGRFLYLFKPTKMANQTKLESLIVEHMPTTWCSFFTYTGPFLFFIPLGVYALLSDLSLENLFILSLVIPCVILSLPMVRILRVMSFLYVFIAAHGVRKIKSSLVFALFGIFAVLHCVFVAGNDFSDNYIQYEVETPQGIKFAQDILEGYRWLYENTPPSSSILSWWDLGYQIRTLANRAVMTDGYTTNSTHIALMGLMFALNEDDSSRIARHLGGDYVVVHFGGASGFRSDDLMKFTHSVALVSRQFPFINPSKYMPGKDDPFNVGHSMHTEMSNSTLFKLSYNNFEKFKFGKKYPYSYDFFRSTQIPKTRFKLKFYEEVFTSENWMVRVYKVKDGPMWP